MSSKIARDEHKYPRTWTGDMLLDRALEVAGFRAEDLRAALGRTRDALDATTPTKTLYDKDGEVRAEIGGGPDHATRLRAAEDLFEWLGFRGKRSRDDDGGPAKIVAVAFHFHAAPVSANGNGHARAALPARRLQVHLEGDDGGADS